MFRTFELRRGLRVQFRAEAFNAFNFVNLQNPRNNIAAADPGRITTALDARVMQLGFRMTF